MPLRLGIALEISAVPFTEEKPEEKPFTCNLCQRQFSLMGVLKAHFQRTHPNQPFKSSYSVSSSHTEKNITATTPPKPNDPQIRRSVSNLFTKNDSSYKCDVCEKDFPKRIELIKHQFIHRRFNVTNISTPVGANNIHHCNTCKKDFFKAHHFKSHTNMKCELCNYMHCHTWLYSKEMCPDQDDCIYCKRELCERCHTLHLLEKKTHVKEPEGLQECFLCKENFETKKDLKDHYVSFHKLKKVVY